jgi:hypothetical protein
MLRNVSAAADGTATATVWVQTDAAATVEVLGSRGRTFEVHGHHYAVVEVPGLAPGSRTPYAVTLDGVAAWPPRDYPFPAPAIRVPAQGAPYRLVFGSCRTALPHDAAFVARYGPDALRAYAHRLARAAAEDVEHAWPSLLMMLGDQVYADETSPAIQAFISARRDIDAPPGKELADFAEYAEVYRLAWADPAIRWLLACVPSAMIFDDHDIRDDWNTSAAWRAAMTKLPWWRGRIVAGLSAYWVYQHLGNLTPAERAGDELLKAVRECGGDAGPMLDAFAERADAHPETARWSYTRELGGGARLVVLDSRAARVLDPAERAMLDPEEMAWVDRQVTGDVSHLLLATSVPYLLPTGLHEFEGWSEAVCAGAWGPWAAKVGEKIRQRADLEHWGAFRRSFDQLQRMVAEVALGRRGKAPATIAFLSGDVHNSYYAKVAGPPRSAPIYQLVCSPMRNELPAVWRLVHNFSRTPVSTALGTGLARLAGVPRPKMRWSVQDGQNFVNALATLELDGREALVRWETAIGRTGGIPAMAEVTRARLS